MIGQRVSHYEILAKLGQGGMGSVYKARDVRLDRVVALKFLSPQLITSPAARARFFEEARAISTLNHPNIATIYEVDEADGNPFLALEYLPGGTVRHKIAGGQAPLEEILRYAVPIGRGLAHAHRRGIIHRDVKCSNAMLGAEGQVKLTDFGLSRRSGSEPLTLAGSIMGTARCMSPEQAQGQSVDRRSDIFSFGVALYEMATGESPFGAESDVAALYNVVHAAAPAVEDKRPDLPAAYGQIVRRALEKKPEDRYQRMEELVADLRQLGDIEVDESPSTQPTASMSPAATDIVRRWRRRAWVGAALAAVLLAVVAWLFLRDPGGRWPPWRQIPAQKQLAVLPFTNVGGDPANQAFCDGVMETLSSALTQMERFQSALMVVPASEIRSQQVSSPSAAQKAFGVNLSITGSVERTGQGVRVNVNLVDTRALRQIAARRIDATLDDITALQDGVAAQVAELLELELEAGTRGMLALGGTRDSRAYDAYVQARGCQYRFDKEGNPDKALQLLAAAVARDPNYALAHAALAEACAERFRQTKNTEWLERGTAAAERAVALAERLAPAQEQLGSILALAGRHAEAVVVLQRALSLDPVSARVYRELADSYVAQRKPVEAEAIYKRAIQMRPGDWMSYLALGMFYFRQQRYAEAEAPFRKIVELTPDNHLGYRNLGPVYVSLGRLNEAVPVMERALAIRPTPVAYSNLASLYIYQGRYEEAVPLMEKAIQFGGANHANDFRFWGNLGDAYGGSPAHASKAPEAYRRAIEAAQRQLTGNPKDASIRSSLAVYWAKLGDKDRAAAEIATALADAPADLSVGFKSAIVHELAGRRREALDAVERVVKGGYSMVEVRLDPALAELCKDPRFMRLAAGLSSTQQR